MNKQDELMHPVGNDPAWSESYYFNFVDPESKIAMFSRMGFRPNNGWADGLHVVYLGGDRVAFTREAIGDVESHLTGTHDNGLQELSWGARSTAPRWVAGSVDSPWGS